jgi:hypothetical protein
MRHGERLTTAGNVVEFTSVIVAPAMAHTAMRYMPYWQHAISPIGTVADECGEKPLHTSNTHISLYIAQPSGF